MEGRKEWSFDRQYFKVRPVPLALVVDTVIMYCQIDMKYWDPRSFRFNRAHAQGQMIGARLSV